MEFHSVQVGSHVHFIKVGNGAEDIRFPKDAIEWKK